MENRAHAIVAVGFLIVFSVGAVLIFYWLSTGPGEPRLYRIVTRQSVAGLSPQSSVEFKGLLVGHVDSIRFDPRDRSRVIVDFRVRRDTYVSEATYAVLAMQGLMGGKILQLKLGDGSSQPLDTSAGQPAHIPLRKGMIAQLKDAAKQNLQTLHAVLSGAKAIVGADNRAHITALLQHLNTLSASLVGLEQQLTPAVAQLPQLLSTTRKTLDQAQALLASADKLVKQAHGPVAQAGAAAATIGNVGQALNKRTLPDIDVLVTSLTRTSRLLQDLVSELAAKPQSVIFGPPEPRPGPGEPGFNINAGQGAANE